MNCGTVEIGLQWESGNAHPPKDILVAANSGNKLRKNHPVLLKTRHKNG